MDDFAVPSLGDSGSQVDATNLDSNIQTISAVESTWRAPALPDEVKLDLAMQPGVSPQGLRSFLQQVDSDLADDDDQPIEEEPAQPEQQRSGYDLARVVIADLAGEPPPTSPSTDAIVEFKQRAIRDGYLDMQETRIDSTWAPELNNIRYEMAFDEYDSSMRGDRYGAVDARNFIDVLGDWTQPTSLLSAATELDLWWDFGAVNREFSSWGDKFRKLQDSSSPWDFGKNLVDAVTGPVDDIVMQIVNWGLIATGVGGVYAPARLGILAGRAGRAGNFVEGLYKSSKVKAGINLADIARPSWTAEKLLKGGRTAERVGGAMAAWRGATGVKRTKQAVQLGMRLGVTSQAQDLLPGYQGGRSLADTFEPVSSAAESLKSMGWNPVFMPVELALAPYNIFAPGTFLGKSGAIKRTASGLYTFAGSDLSTQGAKLGRLGEIAGAGIGPGRAALGAAVGAGVGTLAGDDIQDVGVGALIGGVGLSLAPGVGKIGKHISQSLDGASFVGSKRMSNGLHKLVGTPSDFLETMSFKPLAENQKTAAAFHRAYEASLQSQPEQLAKYQEGWAETNSLTGAVAYMAGVDEETAAAMITWRMMTAAIDNLSGGMADMIKNGSRQQRFHDFRNAYIGQLRTFDINFEGVAQWEVDDLIQAAALTKHTAENPKAYWKKVDQLRKQYKDDPSGLLELANTHNENANRTLRDLLSDENLNEEVLFTHLKDTNLDFGDWPKFTSADEQITEALHGGLLDDAEFLPYIGQKGAPKKFRAGSRGKKESTRLIREGLDDTVLGPTADLSKTVTNRNISTLVAEAPSGRLTIARIDTATGQEIQSFLEELTRLRRLHEGVSAARKTGLDFKKLEETAGAPLSQLTEVQIKEALRKVTQSKTGKFAGTTQNLIEYAAQKGIDPHELLVRLDDMVQEMVDDSERFVKMGFNSSVRGTDGQVLSGAEALKARIADLKKQVHYTAAEVDLQGLIAKKLDAGDVEAAEKLQALAEGLDARGYKLVHGKEFILPHDLNKDFTPFKNITTRHLHAESMGNVFRRRPPAERLATEERLQKAAIAKALSRSWGKDVNVERTEVSEVLWDLKRILSNLQQEANGTIDKLWQENWYRRRIASLNTSFTPLRVDDLASRQDEVIEALVDMGYNRPTANGIIEAIPSMRNSEFSDVGLYAIEAWMRKNNQGAQFLKFVTGGKSPGLISGRNAYMAAGGYAGYQIGQDFGPESEDGNFGASLVGGALGAVGGNLAARGMTALANADGAVAAATGLAKRGGEQVIEGPGSAFGAATIVNKNKSLMRRVETSRHGYLADTVVRYRDALRFTLSPFFDLSRYTEGLMLAQTAAPLRNADGSRMALHLNMTPTALRRRAIKSGWVEGADLSNPDAARRAAHDWFDREREIFRAAAKGDFDPDVLDSTGKWFTQVGIMGFNPTDWMTSAFIELRNVGNMDPETAYKAVREMYTYGTHGRSAAEMSVNFVLFPFSFQKKALTHLGKWMNSDLSRSIMIHDAMATYEILDEKYDLNEYWRDHMPMLEQLQKLNLFAYGISGGRLGGINRAMVEPFISMGQNYAMQLFSPQGASIKDAAAAAEFQNIFRSLTPALNDINWMAESVRQQTNVFTSESNMTIDAEVREGYNAWNQYRQDLSDRLDREGYTWGELRSKPHLAGRWAEYQAKRAEIGRTYPAWFDSRTRTTQNRIALEMEKSDRLARAQEGVDVTREDFMLAEMEQLLAELKYEGSLRNMDLGGNDGWSDAPPAVFDFVRRRAISMMERDPKFGGIWEKFYRKEFGPLEAQV